MRERDLDRMFVDACKRHGIVTYKTSSIGARGFADRTLIGPGRRVGFVELKGPNGKHTHHQSQFEARIKNAGAFYRVLFAHPDRSHTYARVLATIDQYLASAGGGE